MIGSDICGFNGDTNEELCARWIEVGAFYPFSRDHNTRGALPQELYRWESVTSAAKKALSKRYQLLPYYYTLFYQAHRDGEPVIQSLWMNFPKDPTTFSIDSQFMVGSWLLVSPVLHPGAKAVKAYFPDGLWYDFSSKHLAVNATDAGKWVELATPLTEVQTHVRGGSILAIQETPVMTTTAGRKTPFTLLVALCRHSEALGTFFWDDGEQMELDHYLTADFEAEVRRSGFSHVSSEVTHDSYSDSAAGDQVVVGKVVVTGKGLTLPKEVQVNGEVLSRDDWTFDLIQHILTVDTTAAKISMNRAFRVTWH